MEQQKTKIMIAAIRDENGIFDMVAFWPHPESGGYSKKLCVKSNGSHTYEQAVTFFKQTGVNGMKGEDLEFFSGFMQWNPSFGIESGWMDSETGKLIVHCSYNELAGWMSASWIKENNMIDYTILYGVNNFIDARKAILQESRLFVDANIHPDWIGKVIWRKPTPPESPNSTASWGTPSESEKEMQPISPPVVIESSPDEDFQPESSSSCATTVSKDSLDSIEACNDVLGEAPACSPQSIEIDEEEKEEKMSISPGSSSEEEESMDIAPTHWTLDQTNFRTKIASWEIQALNESYAADPQAFLEGETNWSFIKTVKALWKLDEKNTDGTEKQLHRMHNEITLELNKWLMCIVKTGEIWVKDFSPAKGFFLSKSNGLLINQSIENFLFYGLDLTTLPQRKFGWMTKKVDGEEQILFGNSHVFGKGTPVRTKQKTFEVFARTMTAFEIWKHHPSRAYRHEAEFIPYVGTAPESPNLNTFTGYDVRFNRNACIRYTDWMPNIGFLLNHLRYVMCESDEQYIYLLNWLAFRLQFPHKKPGIAPTFIGPQGVGKSLFWSTYLQAFGDYGKMVLRPEEIYGNFTALLNGGLIRIFDENVANSPDPKVGAWLNNLITNTKEVVRLMRTDPMLTESFCAYVLIANRENLVIPTTSEDLRRYAVMSCRVKEYILSPAMRELLNAEEAIATYTREFGKVPTEGDIYDTLKKRYFDFYIENYPNADTAEPNQLEALRTFFNLLYNWPLGDFNINKIPTSTYHMQLRSQSLRPVHKWWFQCLVSERIVGHVEDSWPEGRPFNEENVYRCYLSATKSHGGISYDVFRKQMNEACPALRTGKGRGGLEGNGVTYTFPSLTQSRIDFDAKILSGALAYFETIDPEAEQKEQNERAAHLTVQDYAVFLPPKVNGFDIYSQLANGTLPVHSFEHFKPVISVVKPSNPYAFTDSSPNVNQEIKKRLQGVFKPKNLFE